MSFRYSVILGFMGQLQDRFSVYHEQRTLAQKMALVREITGVTGVEMVFPTELSDVALVKDLLAQHDLTLSAVNVNIKGDPRWHQGALTARDRETRREAVRWLMRGMDIAAELGNGLVTVCPLADGHDYPFEVNYSAAWRNFVDGVREAADHRPDVRLSLEYKPSEPRARVVLGNASKCLYACMDVDRPNVGVTLDMGHALYAGESCAESVALIADAGRLFLVHGNDNYRNWDWDLIPGVVNFLDLVESTFYLLKTGYSGWVAFDVFPARLDPVRTMRSSLRMYQLVLDLIDRVGAEALAKSLEEEDVPATLELLMSQLEQHNIPA
ncbi:MAG: sugar phosphate isomerase/epimerase [Anaerolineae bacterium]|nr:sugar phosphate isomerase/epimerase [Anaerolineae bacterium]